jgi:hypothetical protein
MSDYIVPILSTIIVIAVIVDSTNKKEDMVSDPDQYRSSGMYTQRGHTGMYHQLNPNHYTLSTAYGGTHPGGDPDPSCNKRVSPTTRVFGTGYLKKRPKNMDTCGGCTQHNPIYVDYGDLNSNSVCDGLCSTASYNLSQ